MQVHTYYVCRYYNLNAQNCNEPAHYLSGWVWDAHGIDAEE